MDISNMMLQGIQPPKILRTLDTFIWFEFQVDRLDVSLELASPDSLLAVGTDLNHTLVRVARPATGSWNQGGGEVCGGGVWLTIFTMCQPIHDYI